MTAAPARELVNGGTGPIDPADRGLAYGDGLFETLAVRGGRPELWSRHLERLRDGCGRLCIPAPDPALLAAEARRVTGRDAEGVLRLTVTRGAGPRGYRAPQDLRPTRIVQFWPGALPRPGSFPGIELRLCATRLARQPLLAGLKHLNRLEQVLARLEWEQGADEGLMLDGDDHLVEGIASNLFWVEGERLVTPALDHCGVAGVVRQVLLDAARDEGRPVDIVRANPSVLAAVSEVYVCNSVWGVRPVLACGELRWPAGPWAATAQRWLAAAIAADVR